MSLVKFEFEELPLIVVSGVEAGLINGSANIHAHVDGEWFVDEIFLDGYRKAAVGFELVPTEVERTSPLFLLILDQLENGRFRTSVESAVAAALDADDVRPRSDFSEHNTLSHAQQGC